MIDVLGRLPVGGADGGTDHDTHHECRSCGYNLAPDADGCPACGGSVATYRLS